MCRKNYHAQPCKPSRWPPDKRSQAISRVILGTNTTARETLRSRSNAKKNKVATAPAGTKSPGFGRKVLRTVGHLSTWILQICKKTTILIKICGRPLRSLSPASAELLLVSSTFLSFQSSLARPFRDRSTGKDFPLKLRLREYSIKMLYLQLIYHILLNEAAYLAPLRRRAEEPFCLPVWGMKEVLRDGLVFSGASFPVRGTKEFSSYDELRAPEAVETFD